MGAKVDISRLTLMDALDLAQLIEVEALQRYTHFAKRLGTRDPNDAGAAFQAMAANEQKHAEQLAMRRQALFGNARPKVKLDDVFDVEAPEFGAPRWNMSQLQAFQVALASERKAFAFYDTVLAGVKLAEVRALFEELRDEEAGHIAMIEGIIAKLPPSAAIELEDEDDDPGGSGV
jgi:rubrerythrin